MSISSIQLSNFFRITPPANIVSDFSVASALRADDLLDPIAVGWRNALQLLGTKLAFYRLAHLVAQFIGRWHGQQESAYDEQLESSFRCVAFLEQCASRQSRANIT